MKNNIIPHCQDSSNRKTRKYHTVMTVPTFMKNNTIPHCQDSSNRKMIGEAIYIRVSDRK
jgi:hypothetical protein